MRDLTGRFYHKKTISGMVLMVECIITTIDEQFDVSPPIKVWNKAKEEDLVYLKFEE